MYIKTYDFITIKHNKEHVLFIDGVLNLQFSMRSPGIDILKSLNYNIINLTCNFWILVWSIKLKTCNLSIYYTSNRVQKLQVKLIIL